MKAGMFGVIAIPCAVLFLMAGSARDGIAQEAKTPYPSMAPVEQYLMGDRNAEIELARSAAPPTVSGDAEILVMGRQGYETAVHGRTVSCAWSSAPGQLLSTVQISGTQSYAVRCA